MKRTSLLILASILCLTACGDSSTTSVPITPADVTGNWIGRATDSVATRGMGFLFAQDGRDVVGPALISIAGAPCEGSVVGTVVGQEIRFTASFRAGDCDAPSESCSLTVNGDGVVDGNAISGDYTGESTCEGSLRGGVFTLARQ